MYHIILLLIINKESDLFDRIILFPNIEILAFIAAGEF